jgi:hypothetical protein
MTLTNLPSSLLPATKRKARCLGCGASVEVAQENIRVYHCAACPPKGRR